MLRALTRSIFGKNCGASFCSTSMQRTPRRPRSTASVNPVGPPPAMRTWVSIYKSYSANPIIVPAQAGGGGFTFEVQHLGEGRGRGSEVKTLSGGVVVGTNEGVEAFVGRRCEVGLARK